MPSISPFPSMPDTLISESGVLKLLHELKVHKAAGPDQIRPSVLRELSHIIHVAPILALIYRRSCDTAQVPDYWKKAYVTPVFKKGRRSEAGNYRSISLTCIACKIMEHILVSNIMKHANGNNILYHLQYGFREKRSCETQLLEFVHDLACNMQGGGANRCTVTVSSINKLIPKMSDQQCLMKVQNLFNPGCFLLSLPMAVMIDST